MRAEERLFGKIAANPEEQHQSQQQNRQEEQEAMKSPHRLIIVTLANLAKHGAKAQDGSSVEDNMKKNLLIAVAFFLSVTAGTPARAEEPDFSDIVKQIAQKLGGDDLYARGEAAKM